MEEAPNAEVALLVDELKRIRERVPVRLDVDPIDAIPIFIRIAHKLASPIPRRQSALVKHVIRNAVTNMSGIEQEAVNAQFGLSRDGATLSSAHRRKLAAECYHYSLSHFRQRGLEDKLFTSLAEVLLALEESPTTSHRTGAMPKETGTHKTTKTIPHQLPSSDQNLTGRDSSFTALHDLWLQLQANPHSTAKIIVVSGAAGIGKTALALHWSHQIQKDFSDGNLFVNLHGYDFAQPAQPAAVLEHFLRSLNVSPEDIPEDLEQRAALYRSIMHTKKSLILLDNAADVQQIRPLLPAAEHCLILVTSRSTLSGLAARESALRIVIEKLSSSESTTLLAQKIGAARIDQENTAAAKIVEICDGLPLALRIVSEQANLRPEISLTTLAHKLASEETRFSTLELADDPSSSVWAIFEYSYRSLSPEQARLFCLLGLHAGPTFTIEAASALADLSFGETDLLLQGLHIQHLVEEKTSGEFEFHDLVRRYAQKVCTRDYSPQIRHEALRRELTWYLAAAIQGSHWLMPQRKLLEIPSEYDISPLPLWITYEEALAWCEAERANLAQATQQAFEHRLDDLAWRLPVALRGFYNLRKHWSDWLSTHLIGLKAAKRLDDSYAEGRILNGLGTGCLQLGKLGEARVYHQQALECRIRADDRIGQGSSLAGLGQVYRRFGRIEDAIGCYRRSMAIRIRIRDKHGQGWSLNDLGEIAAAQGKHHDAITFFIRSLVLRREVRDFWGEGLTLHNLGCALRDDDQIAEAARFFESSLRIRTQIGDRWGIARTLYQTANLDFLAGQPESARRRLHEALIIAESLGDTFADQIRKKLEAN